MLLMEKGFISTGMFFFVYVLLIYIVVPMFNSLSFKKEKHTLVALYVMCMFVIPSQNLERS